MTPWTAVVPEGRPLEPAEKAVLAAEILASYVRSRWWLARGDLPAALGRLRRARRKGVPVRDPTLTGRRLGRAVVRTLSPLPTDSRCLMRSLVLTALLARRGIDSRLVLGVRRGETFMAHAWVEHGALPLLDPGEREFERLAEL